MKFSKFEKEKTFFYNVKKPDTFWLFDLNEKFIKSKKSKNNKYFISNEKMDFLNVKNKVK
jgi:hypothetical protein